MNSQRWLPFWMPFVIFGVAFLAIFGGGFFLLSVALATYDLIPGLHSGGVIIAALTMALLVGALATYFALSGNRQRPEADQHGPDAAH